MENQLGDLPSFSSSFVLAPCRDCNFGFSSAFFGRLRIAFTPPVQLRLLVGMTVTESDEGTCGLCYKTNLFNEENLKDKEQENDVS